MTINLYEDEEPIGKTKCLVKIDEQSEWMTTDADGALSLQLSPDARRVVVVPEGFGEYVLILGALQPIESIEGVKQRLRRIGYYEGPMGDGENAALQVALKALQRHIGLDESGDADRATRDILIELCGT